MESKMPPPAEKSGLRVIGAISFSHFLNDMILASAFSAILVFAQELMPGKVGAVSGLFFGFAFGMGGIGAALLSKLAGKSVNGVRTVHKKIMNRF